MLKVGPERKETPDRSSTIQGPLRLLACVWGTHREERQCLHGTTDWLVKAVTSALRRGHVTAPILLRFPSHGFARSILALKPMRRRTGAVRRAESLRHDAFQAHEAGVVEHL